jgi:hypothetical protein
MFGGLEEGDDAVTVETILYELDELGIELRQEEAGDVDG